MESIIIVIIACVLTIYFIYSYYTSYNESIYIESELDNNKYLIRRGKSKSDSYLKDSANTLAKIHSKITKLIQHLRDNFSNDASKNYFIAKLADNYNAKVLSEAALDQRYTTFTVDKKDMHICLRTRDNTEQVYEIDLLMYVILHELAHLCNYNANGKAIQGHGEEFKSIFKFLVREAVKIGVYTYTDYNNKPKEYCGIMITTQIVVPADI